jgi:hypothetical protein
MEIAAALRDLPLTLDSHGLLAGVISIALDEIRAPSRLNLLRTGANEG